MVMAALLRSVARKMARAPPARPLLARAGAGLWHGGSLPPLTSNGAAAVAGIRSLASKIAHAPRPHHQLLHTSPNPAFSSPSPPTSGKRDFNAKLAKVGVGVAYFTVILSAIHIYAVYLPEKKKWRTKLEALSRENSDLKDAIQAITDENERMTVQVQKMLLSGHEKEPYGANKMDTKVHNLDDEVAKLHGIMELKDSIKNLQAKVAKLKIEMESSP